MKSTIKWAISALLVASIAPANAQSPSTVLVVANQNNPNSVSLANYYMSKRSIPAQNKLLLKWNSEDNADTISLAAYNSSIAAPVYAKIASLPQIDYILICRNLPLKISDTGGSVDSALAGKSTTKRYNPYYSRSTPFSSKTFGVYLVTRLDGWSWQDSFSLVDRAVAPTTKAPILLDGDPTKDANTSYKIFNWWLGRAANVLASKGAAVISDNTVVFRSATQPLAGYISWGSNDAHFSPIAYSGLTFVPGAIAETLVSTSGSNVRYPGGWQSQISTLIHNGVTGVKGYVNEPLADATANPYFLFPNYLSGMNLASSFYSASAYMGWRDVVIGDPLCAPYRR